MPEFTLVASAHDLMPLRCEAWASLLAQKPRDDAVDDE